MFSRFKNGHAYDNAEDTSWEEVERTLNDEESVSRASHILTDEKADSREDGTEEFNNAMNPDESYECVDNDGGRVTQVKIEIDGGEIDTMDFPAIRRAFGYEEQLYSNIELQEGKENDSDEDTIGELIIRYAQIEEGSAEGNASWDDRDQDLPCLFRMQNDISEQNNVSEDNDRNQETDISDFSMDSELERQREISGELFDYIDSINAYAEEIISNREREFCKLNSPKEYDPYNLDFNNRYDDTEEVLSSTPEISMLPKYTLGD